MLTVKQATRRLLHVGYSTTQSLTAKVTHGWTTYVKGYKSNDVTLHLVMTLLWASLLIPTLLWWRESVLWVALMSLYANIVGHWSAYQAAKAERKAAQAAVAADHRMDQVVEQVSQGVGHGSGQFSQVAVDVTVAPAKPTPAPPASSSTLPSSPPYPSTNYWGLD